MQQPLFFLKWQFIIFRVHRTVCACQKGLINIIQLPFLLYTTNITGSLRIQRRKQIHTTVLFYILMLQHLVFCTYYAVIISFPKNAAAEQLLK